MKTALYFELSPFSFCVRTVVTNHRTPSSLVGVVSRAQTRVLSARMPSPNTTRIQRKYLRYRCNQRLCVRYRIDGQDFIAYGRCTVVGEGGIGALLPAADLEIGQVVSLEVSLSTPAAPRPFKAQLKNRHGSKCGFQFMESDGRAAAMLGGLFQPDAVMAFAPFTSR